jgi:hypothetical protein
VKFIFADSLDVVDPSYDFETDQSGAEREPHWGDRYPHELMTPTPYDGVLVSRGIVGDHLFPGKYSSAQAMRFRRDGARKFLRLDGSRFKHMPIYGDSGAFSYVKEEKPPYTPAQVLETPASPMAALSITSSSITNAKMRAGPLEASRLASGQRSHSRMLASSSNSPRTWAGGSHRSV